MKSPNPHQHDSLVYFSIIIHTILGAGTYPIVKRSLVEIPPLVFAFYRFTLSAFIILVILAFRRHVFSYLKTDWRLLLLLAVLAVPLNQGLFLLGMPYTQPTHAALLYATTPVWVYILGLLKKEESLSLSKSIGILIALVGVLIFFAEKGLKFNFEYLWGDLLILIAVWCWAAYTIYGRPLVQRRGAVNTTALSLLIGSAIYLPIGIPLASSFDYAKVTPVAWSGVLYTAALTSVALYSLWYWIVARIEPSRAAVFMNLQPLVTAILSYLLLGEILSAVTIIAGLIIIFGVYITQRR